MHVYQNLWVRDIAYLSIVNTRVVSLKRIDFIILILPMV